MIPTSLSEDSNNKIISSSCGLIDCNNIIDNNNSSSIEKKNNKNTNKNNMSCLVSSSDSSTNTISSSPFKYIFKRGTDMKFHFGFLKRRHTESSLVSKDKSSNNSSSSVRPSPEEAAKWANSFHDVVSSKYGQALFKAFLARDFCEENIEFWLAIEEYRKITRANKLAAKAQKILNEFIIPQSPKEINLDSLTRQNLISHLLTSSPTTTTFDQAQKRTQGLLEADAYPRFLKSDLYLELCYPEKYCQ